MLSGVETRSVSPVFVGRADELAVLVDALGRAADQEPQAFLIGGEAGVGKTRLTEEFLGEATRRGAVVAVGGCVEIGAEGLPFAPFSTALRTLLRLLPGELAAAAAGQEDELARILPELGETPRGPHDEESTARLFELTARMLERLAADRTVVLVLEDLHWADTSTRHLLAYLFRTLGRGRLVLVATYRADDIHRRHPLRPLLAELDRFRTVQRIELARFNRGEVRRQLAGILASRPDEAFVASVFDRSDGNAFFVEELVACHESGCRTGLTESLRDLLLVRVEVLPDAAQRVVRIVAEGGSTIEYPLLRAVAGLGEDELIEALRAAVGANILLATSDGDGYRFRHSLVREAVSDDLLPGERARVNRRYAEALEDDDTLIRADERTIRLANYWYAANDPAKALPAVLAASITARRRHAYSEQLSLLERAMELWESAPAEVRDALRPVDYTEVYPPCGSDPAGTPVYRVDLLAEATVAARYGGERERALKLTKLALRILDEDGGDPLRAAWFWTERSRLIASLGRGDGWHEIATAQELVKGLPPSQVHADVLVRAAGWGMLHNPGPGNLAAAERAVEYARMVGAEETELNARITRGYLLMESGDTATGLAELHEVKDRAAERGFTVVAGRAHINITSQLESLGRSAKPWNWPNKGSNSSAGPGSWTPRPGSAGTWRRACTALAAGTRPPKRPGAPCTRATGPPPGAPPPHAWPTWPWAAANSAKPPPSSLPPTPTSAPTTASPSTGSRSSGWPSASPRAKAASPTSAPRRHRPSPTASRPASTATPGPSSWRPPPPKRTQEACPAPRRAGPPPWKPCAPQPAPWPPRYPCGPPTPSTSGPSCCAPRAATASPTGRPSRRPSAPWSAPTSWPAPATGSPRPCWARAGTGRRPPACSATPTPPPTGSAPDGSARTWPCWPSAPGSR